MATAILILRITLLVFGTLAALFYLLFQMYRKMPAEPFSLSTADMVVYLIVAFIFGFGINSYYGLAAFLPLLLFKYVCLKCIQPNHLRGSGRWMQVEWKKFTPKGFERNVPKAVLAEMNKMPQSTHFIIPRFYMNIFLSIISKRMKKEASKLPAGVSQAQQEMATGQMMGLVNGIAKLGPGQTEKKDFPFGMLRVTRL